MNGFIALATCTVERTESLVVVSLEWNQTGRRSSREDHVSSVEAQPSGDWRRRVDWLAGLVAACSILTMSARHWWVADLIADHRAVVFDFSMDDSR